MLNSYHKSFLCHLESFGVRFLVIGGQARWVSQGKPPTSDLDIWIKYEKCNLIVFVNAFLSWAERYGNHISVRLQIELNNIQKDPNSLETKITRKIQFQLPDDDTFDTLSSSEPIRLTEFNNIDILFSTNFDQSVYLNNIEFETLAASSISKAIGDSDILFVCNPPPKKN